MLWNTGSPAFAGDDLCGTWSAPQMVNESADCLHSDARGLTANARHQIDPRQRRCGLAPQAGALSLRCWRSTRNGVQRSWRRAGAGAARRRRRKSARPRPKDDAASKLMAEVADNTMPGSTGSQDGRRGPGEELADSEPAAPGRARRRRRARRRAASYLPRSQLCLHAKP